MDPAELAAFLRTRRGALRPEDVGLPRARRRRARGLRREEVAALANMSTDYYTRIEQQRGPRPSERILAAVAGGLRLSVDERDHLFRLAGYAVPHRLARTDRVNPGISAIFQRMDDTPAQIINLLGETLAQNRLSALLVGDQSRHAGLSRILAYRWFTDLAERRLFPVEDHAKHGRTITAQLRAAHSRDRTDPHVLAVVDALLKTSEEFAEIWSEHPVAGPYCEPKRIEHPQLGALEVHGHSLADPDQTQILMVFTAPSGSESHDKLQLLAVRGHQFV